MNSLTPRQNDWLRSLVLERSAIVIEAGKEYLIESRLAPLAKELGMAGVADLVDRLAAGRDETLRRRVVEAMTTNETSFFRDQHPFEALRKTILPELIAARANERRLEIWCAACSTGQEPYSIAMLLLEHFPQLASWQVRITATDLAETILARARAGIFSRIEVNRGLPAPLLLKYFTQDDSVWRIDQRVQRMIEFRQLNLADRWPAMPRMDVVFLRNVLIYFAVPTKRRILETARSSMRGDGYLCLGAAETTLGVCDEFERCGLDKAVFYRPRTLAGTS